MKETLFSAIIVLSIILASCKCRSQKNSTLPITVTIKVDSTYELRIPKEAYAREIKEYDYAVDVDSVKQKYYDISIILTNASTRSISIWLMTCSWQRNFLVNNNYISLAQTNCDSNFPSLVEIKSGEHRIYKTTLAKSIEFDYPCRNCFSSRWVETTKLGLIIIDDIFNRKLGVFDYHIYMADKSKWEVIWSNPLFLLDKR